MPIIWQIACPYVALVTPLIQSILALTEFHCVRTKRKICSTSGDTGGWTVAMYQSLILMVRSVNRIRLFGSYFNRVLLLYERTFCRLSMPMKKKYIALARDESPKCNNTWNVAQQRNLSNMYQSQGKNQTKECTCTEPECVIRFFYVIKKNLQIEWNHINFTFFSVIVFIILMSTVWIIGCLISMLFDTQLIKRSFSFFSAEIGFWNGIYEWNVTSFKFRNRRFTHKKISPLKECHYSHSSMIF